MIVRRLGVWSVARLLTCLYAGLGLVIGAIVALISLAGAGFATAAARDAGAQNAGIFAAVFGVGAVIFLPIFYGLIGLVSGALTAALYNLFAGMVGGIEIDVQS